MLQVYYIPLVKTLNKYSETENNLLCILSFKKYVRNLLPIKSTIRNKKYYFFFQKCISVKTKKIWITSVKKSLYYIGTNIILCTYYTYTYLQVIYTHGEK